MNWHDLIRVASPLLRWSDGRGLFLRLFGRKLHVFGRDGNRRALFRYVNVRRP